MTRFTSRNETFALQADIVRETDKALLVTCYDMKSGRHHDVWFPKSQIERGTQFIFIPGWLLDAKVRDTGRSLGVTALATARQIEADMAPAIALAA